MEIHALCKVIVDKILQKAHSSGSLITATVLTALGANIVRCDQYMAVVMAGRMYAQAYPDRGLHPKNLSRAVKDSATVTGCIVYQKKRSGFSQMAEDRIR